MLPLRISMTDGLLVLRPLIFLMDKPSDRLPLRGIPTSYSEMTIGPNGGARRNTRLDYFSCNGY